METQIAIFRRGLYQAFASQTDFNDGQLESMIQKFDKIVHANNAPETAFRVIWNAYGSHDRTDDEIRTINQEIEKELGQFSKTHKSKSSSELMKISVDKFNSAVSNAQILVNGKLLEPEIFECMKVSIPSALRAKEKLKEAYAASAPSKRIHELSITVKL